MRSTDFQGYERGRRRIPLGLFLFQVAGHPRHVRRQMIRDASQFGRTWMHGRTWVVADIFNCDARKMYSENWDGCRDLWKEYYRKRRLFRLVDRPIGPRPKAHSIPARQTDDCATSFLGHGILSLEFG
jgi:hypothetical protein